jgi:hypothetical protein
MTLGSQMQVLHHTSVTTEAQQGMCSLWLSGAISGTSQLQAMTAFIDNRTLAASAAVREALGQAKKVTSILDMKEMLATQIQAHKELAVTHMKHVTFSMLSYWKGALLLSSDRASRSQLSLQNHAHSTNS